MGTEYLIEKSKEYFEKGYRLHSEGNYDGAIVFYEKSLEVFPTAEAFTFKGWSLSMKGEYEKAIDECKKAIDIDPDYGNPYNDIGAYLISLGQYEEAAAWLELALKAAKYSNKEFAFYNLGVVYEKMGLWFEALAEYKKAEDENPAYIAALKARGKLQSLMN
ncbi:MAG: tetratricopeptide repeat protein [Bacteroidetes bacterium]|nr:tetratricopeptide repeat protein [Bacteroidota bacterium]